MRVEKGVPKSPPQHDDTLPKSCVSVKTSDAGEGARKHGKGLAVGEACADEDDDEDD